MLNPSGPDCNPPTRNAAKTQNQLKPKKMGCTPDRTGASHFLWIETGKVPLVESGRQSIARRQNAASKTFVRQLPRLRLHRAAV